MQPNIPGPCGSIPVEPPPSFRRGEVMIRLHDEAVTKDGFHPEVLKAFQWIQDAGGRIETIRSASIFAGGSISTGSSSWRVNGKPAVVLNNRPSSWIVPTGDGAWVGAEANNGQNANPGAYVYSLNIGRQLGKRGLFSLVWAADNSVQWTITNGELTGSTSGNDFSFAAVHGAPRSLSGVFQANSVLTATVINASGPTGFLAIGTLGEIPEPNGETGPASSRTSLVLTPTAGQPVIRLGTSANGAPPALGLTFPTTPHELVRSELRNLTARFAIDPSESLIKCLRTVPGIKYVERIPISILSVSPDSGIPEPPMKVPATGGVSGAIGFDKPGPGADNLAILDGVFGGKSGSPSHGDRVFQAAKNYLPLEVKVELWTITEKDGMGGSQFIQKEETTLDFSAYFSALRNIRLRNQYRLSAIRVVNISRGGAPTGMEADEIAEMKTADILVVAAAGQNSAAKVVDFPAAYETVLSVGGASISKGEWQHWPNANHAFAVWEDRFSRKKMTAVDVVAPAKSLNIGSASVSGTSFAAPVVAALCATIRAKFPALSEGDVRKRVTNTARALTGSAATFGKGLIHWANALK